MGNKMGVFIYIRYDTSNRILTNCLLVLSYVEQISIVLFIQFSSTYSSTYSIKITKSYREKGIVFLHFFKEFDEYRVIGIFIFLYVPGTGAMQT